MKPLAYVSLDGKLQSRQSARLPLDSRAFYVGEGLFETIAVSAGQPEWLAEHLDRLYKSAAELSLPAPPRKRLMRWLGDFVAANQLRRGMLRVTLSSQGAGGFRRSARPGVLLISGASGVAYGGRRQAYSAAIVRSVVRVADAGSRHKSTAYLPLLLARREAAARGADFGILLNHSGRVAEADCANLFVVRRDGCIVTPPVPEGALPGVIRGLLLKRLPAIIEAPVTLATFLEARAVALTNSFMPVLPLAREVTSGTRFSASGRLASRLLAALRR